MANLDHLKLLQAGARVWKEWREEYADVPPQLDGADLRQASLGGVDLSGASLFEADLTRADLGHADLSRANLTDAHLEGAGLQRTNLRGARLIGAGLRLASLKNADLRQADLRGADLREADLEAAELGDTVLVDVQMEGAKALNLSRFWSPVSIDHRTFIKSPRLPMAFLRNCGVPEDLIELLPSLFHNPIQCYAVFVTASQEDRELAERLAADLQSRGIRCWTIPEELRQQSAFRPLIPLHEQIAVVVLSKASLESTWLPRLVGACLREERLRNSKLLVLARATESGIHVEPLVEALKSRAAVDFRLWKFSKAYAKAFEDLIQTLRDSYLCGPPIGA
jgi:TIR domain/Pentapeptide repeats (8 copies)